MRIINREHGGGKTTELVRIMLLPGNEDVVFVAPTAAQAERLGYETAVQVFGAKRSKELASRFISASALPNRKDRNERYVIDELEGVISSLVGGEVIAVAGTDELLKWGHVAAREKGMI